MLPLHVVSGVLCTAREAGKGRKNVLTCIGIGQHVTDVVIILQKIDF